MLDRHGRLALRALAVAPYFGYPVPDTFTLDQLFTEIMQGGLVPAAAGGYPGGMVKQTLDWAATNYSIAKARGLPLVAYEGGQTLVDYSHADQALANRMRPPIATHEWDLPTQRFSTAGRSWEALFSPTILILVRIRRGAIGACLKAYCKPTRPNMMR